MNIYKFTKDQICPKYFNTPKGQLFCTLDVKDTFDKKCDITFSVEGCEVVIDRELSADEQKRLGLIISDYYVFDDEQKIRKEEYLERIKELENVEAWEDG